VGECKGHFAHACMREAQFNLGYDIGLRGAAQMVRNFPKRPQKIHLPGTIRKLKRTKSSPSIGQIGPQAFVVLTRKRFLLVGDADTKKDVSLRGKERWRL
jgi:hypothetical protein